MEKKIIDLGNELKLELSMDGDKVRIEAKHEGKLGGAGLYAHTGLIELVDALTDLIPGEWDDRLIDPLVAKMLSKKSEK